VTAAVLGLRDGLGRLLLAAAGRPVAFDAIDNEVEIARLRRKDDSSWSELFAREMPAIYRYALARLGDATDAEDAASQVFEEAWKSAGSLEDHGLPARAWLFGIARNVVNRRRTLIFRKPPALRLELFDGAHDEAGLSPELADLAAAVRALPANQAEVVALRFIHGLSLEETAAVLKTSIDGVKGRQARALARLRESLEVRMPTGAVVRGR